MPHGSKGAIYQLPSGKNEQLNSLYTILKFVQDSHPTDKQILSWFKKKYPKSSSAIFVKLCRITLSKHLSMIEEDNGRYILTRNGKIYLKTHDKDWLYNLLMKRPHFRPIVSQLHGSGPLTLKQIHRKVTKLSGSNWSEQYTRRRLLWLESTGKVIKIGNLYNVNIGNEKSKEIRFSLEDFQSVGSGDYYSISEVRKKFKTLADLLERRISGDSRLGKFVYHTKTRRGKDRRPSPYVSKVVRRNYKKEESKSVKRLIWLGLGHSKYRNTSLSGDPRAGVQFQFGMMKNELNHYGIWVEGTGKYRSIGKRIAENLSKHDKIQIIRSIHRLGSEYRLQVTALPSKGLDIDKIDVEATGLTEEQWDRISHWLLHRSFHFNLKRKMEPRRFVSLGNIDENIITVMRKLLPIYSILEGLRLGSHNQRGSFKERSAPILSRQRISKSTLEDLETEQIEKEFREARKISTLTEAGLESQINDMMKKEILVQDGHNHEDEKRTTFVSVSIRSPKLSALMKRKYNYSCQVCGMPSFEGKDGNNFTESHHLIPRGMNGADDPRNIVIVCPNCHRKFDSGSIKTRIDAYRTIRQKGIFTAFDVLKNCGVITETMYDEIMR